MTKNYFIQLAEYNIWANTIFMGWLRQITDEQWNQPAESSFKSIAETVVHTAGAEKIWFERLTEVQSPVFLLSVFKGTKEEALAIWETTSQNLKSFIENLDETQMQKVLRFVRLDNKTYELEYYQVFAHIFNHSTYHRGQLVTLLRQAGFTGIHSTDVSTYFWSLKH